MRARLLPLAAVTVLSALALGLPPGAAVAQAAERTVLTGVQVHVLSPGNEAADVTRQLDLLADLGSTSLRADVSWGSLQESGPQGYAPWYVQRVDALVEGARARGMRPVLTLLDSPCWASSAPESLKAGCSGPWWERGVQYYAPADVQAYGRAAAFLAQRYGDRIAALELWNEPNYDDHGFSPFIAADRPAAYTALIKAAYPQVKAVAPRLPVLAGALSFSDVGFVRRMWAEGALGSYDALSVHPYNGDRAPGTPVDPKYAMYDYTTGLAALHAAQRAAGDSSDLWITEMGWTDCLGDHPWCVSSEQQGSYLATAYAMALQMPYVAAFLSYDLRDNGTVRTNDQHNYGLVRRDYTVKPAYAALRAAFRAAAVTVPSAAVVPAPTTTPTKAPAATASPSAKPTPATASPSAKPKTATRPTAGRAREQVRPGATGTAPRRTAPKAAPRRATAPKAVGRTATRPVARLTAR